MSNFDQVKKAMIYIDGHLEDTITIRSLAEYAHFSPCYFHRIFTAVTGKTVAAYIRDRRLAFACCRLAESDRKILDIALECGFQSAQAFSRAFAHCFGFPPAEYRRQGCHPSVISVDEMIQKFTNRLRGGIDLNPRIIKKEALLIAGAAGDGNQTGEVWNQFERLSSEQPLKGKVSDNGYEIRTYDGTTCTVHVGSQVDKNKVPQDYTLLRLPASTYAAFDVYVENGYGSENNAMNEWLETNSQGYTERLFDGKHYCVEFYDERFSGNEAGSIVEIWVPIEKKD